MKGANSMQSKFVAKRYWKEEVPAMSQVDELASKYDDIIDLSLGDPDMTTDKIIIDNVYEDMLKGYTRYTEFRGDRELRTEIAKFYEEEYGFHIDDTAIYVTASGTHAMCLAFCAILDPGDEVIVHGPYYPYYINQIEFAGGKPVILDCAEDDFKINPKKLESLINERTKALLLNTPNNPTGMCIGRDLLEEIASVAKAKDILVVADDIYTAFSYKEPFVPIMTLDGMKDRTVTLNSFSKDYTMTGWRVGNIIAPEDIINAVKIVNDSVMFTAPSISQRAAIYALRNRKTIQPPMVEEYRRRLFYAAERINKIKNLSTLPPQGTFYLMVNIKKLGMNSVEASKLLLEKAHVLTIPGISFGKCGEGFVRIACTRDISVLKEAFDRLESVEKLVK